MKILSKTGVLFIFSLLFTLQAMADVSFAPQHVPDKRDPFGWRLSQNAQSVAPGQALSITISFEIPDRHYLYRDKISLAQASADGAKIKLKDVVLPPSYWKMDALSGESREVYEREVSVTAHMDVLDGARVPYEDVSLLLSYQGCSEKVCFLQVETPLNLKVAIAGVAEALPKKAGGCAL